MKYIIEPSNKTLKEILDNIACSDEIHILFKEGFYLTGCTDMDTLHLHAKSIILEGEGNVVIYDNKGHMINSHPYPKQPSSNAHTILVEANKVIVNNITFVNGCNIDFEYNGKVYQKVSECITQAYAFGAWNTDYLEINNSRFYSILDTLTMKNVNISKFNNCYIQGNNDFLPHSKKSYMKDCIVRNMGPYPVWSTDLLAVYDNVTFNIDDNVEEFSFTKRGGNLCFLNCRFNTNLDSISFKIEPNKESRYYIYNTYLNDKSLNLKAYDESIVLLNDKDYQLIKINNIDRLSLGLYGDRILDKELLLKIDIIPDEINISDGLNYTLNGNEIVIKSDIVGNDKECYIEVKKDFLVERFYFKVIGKKVKKPNVIDELEYSINNSKLYVDFNIICEKDSYDESYVLVYQDDKLLYKLNNKGHISLLKSDIGKSFVLKPIYKASDSFPIQGEIIETRIIDRLDVANEIIIDSFKEYKLSCENHLFMSHIKPLYLGDECSNFVSFDIKEEEMPFIYSKGTDNAKHIEGLLYNSRGAALIYPINEIINSFYLDFYLAVEKSSGEGFGSANGQYLELFINYDHKTLSGIALRLERESTTDKGVFMSIREYNNGVNKLISKKVFTKKYLTNCHLIAKYNNNVLEFSLLLGDEADALAIEIENVESSFMLRSTGTIGVGNRMLIRKMLYNFEEKRINK